MRPLPLPSTTLLIDDFRESPVNYQSRQHAIRHCNNGQHYIHRGYYKAARRYDFYLRVVKTIFYERAQRVSKILFLTREDKSHIFKPPCNVLFII